MNVLRFTGNSWPDTADAANNELHLDACARGLCQLIDHLPLGDCIGLDADIAVPTTLDLLIQLLKQHGLNTKRGHQQSLVLSVQLIHEHVTEEGGRILPDDRVHRHEAEVGVHGVGLFIVISGSHLREIGRFIVTPHRDEADLAVTLEAFRAIDHLAARLLQHLRPFEVVLLIEASPKLHDDENLLSVFRCTAEGLRNLRGRGHAIDRDFNRKHLRILCRFI